MKFRKIQQIIYLGKLCTQIGSEWFFLGIHLGFTHVQMEQLRTAHPSSVPQCVSVMLSQWQATLEEYGEETKSTLAKALREIGRADLADDLNGSCQRMSVNLSESQKLPHQCSVDELDNHSGPARRPNSKYGEGKTSMGALQKVKFENNTNDPLHKYIEQSKAYMEQKMKNKDSFVKTRALEQSMACLTNNGIVTIIGNAGDGKTTLAVNMLNRLRANGHIVLVLSDPNILEQCIDPDRRIIYFVDDAFGTPTLNKRFLEIWMRLYDKIDSLISQRKLSLVMTSRKMVILKGKGSIYRRDRYARAIIDITEKGVCLTEVEKTLMIASHCQGHGLFPMKLLRKWTGYSPGFPLICRLYSANQRLRKAEDLFEKPLLILQKDISDLVNHDIAAFCAMVLIVLHDGKLPVEYLDVFEEDGIDEIKLNTIVKAYGLDKSTALSKMEDAMKSILGVYVDEVNDNYVFLHDTIFDTVCLIFGQKHPREIIRIASSEFIEQRIRTKDALCEDNNDACDVIELKKIHFKVLSKRWIKDILNGHIKSVINNPCIQDPDMLSNFLDIVEQLSDSDFSELIGSSDCGRSLLEFVIDENYTALTTQLLKKIKKIKDFCDYEIPQKCFQMLIDRKDAILVRMMLDIDVSTTACVRPYKITSVHCAARAGDLKILHMILEKNKYKSISSKDFFGMEPIHYACLKSNESCLEFLIESGCDLDCKDSDGKRPIHHACLAGSVACVEILQKKGADLNKTECAGRTPIHFAAMSENVEVVSFLLDHGCDANAVDGELCTPLLYACKNGKWQNIKALIHYGADTNIHDVHKKYPIHAAAEGSHSDSDAANACIKLLLGVNMNINAVDDQGKTALHYACAWSFDHRYSIVEMLVELESDINVYDNFKMQPLMYACNSGSFRCAALLLQNGANPNSEGPRGNKPIHLASADGNIEIVKLLISKGVDIKAENTDGRQPIHFSSQYGNDEVICLLLWNKADLNVKDNSGKGPLHYACKWGRSKTVKLLMKMGANPHAKDNDGETPKDLIPKWTTNSKNIRQYLNRPARRPNSKYGEGKTSMGALQKVKFENNTNDPLHKYIEQSKAYMEQKMKNKDSFVKTRALEQSMACLTNNGIVTIIGNAGDGKTTLAVNMLNSLRANGHIVLVLSDPNILEQCIDPDRRIIYFVDDAFGTPTLNKRFLEIWMRLYDKIDSLISQRKLSLVMTSRKMVILKGKGSIYRRDRYARAIIDITEKGVCLTEVEKTLMIASHCQGHGLFPMKLLRKWTGYSPGFPLICRLYSANQRLRKAEDLFEKPLLILQKDISDLVNHDIAAFCAMVLIVLHDGKLPVEYLDVFEEDGIDEIKLNTIVKACIWS